MPPYRDSFILILLFFNACNSQNTTSTCGKSELSCDGTCITLQHLCDGIKDCKTGLDESHETCKKNECPGHTFRCSTGACIEKSKVCNQIDDCLDASDEIPFVCSEKSSPIYEGCGYSDHVKDNGPFPWTIKFYLINDFEGIDEDYTYVKKNWKHYSSGTLVTPNIVITDVSYLYGPTDLTAASAPRDDQTVQIREIKYMVDSERNSRSTIIFDIIIVKLRRPFVFNTFTYAACLDARPIQLQDSFDIYEGVVATSIDKRLYLKEVLSFCTRLISNVTTPKNACQAKESKFEQTVTPSISFSEVHYGMGLFNIVDDRYYLRSVFVSGAREDITFKHVHTYLDFIKKTDPPSSYLGSNNSFSNNKEIKDLDVVSELSETCGKFKDDRVAPYPWHAAIWSERNTSPKRICAGTIIAPKYIVTAASCFWDFKNQRFRDSLLDTYTVSAGFNGETFEQFSKVFHVHTDNYLWESNEQSDVNNLAIVETESNFQFDGLVRPACIDFEEDNIENVHKYSAIMISWLVEGASENFAPGQLRTSLLSEEVCRDYLNNRCTNCKGEVPGDNSKLCLTNDERGSLTDLGAGIFTQKYKRYYLRGILNRPIIPDDESLLDYYRLFTNIIPFNKFIKTILNTYQPKDDIIFEPSVCSSGYDVPCNKSTCIGYMSVCNSECECDNCDDEDELMCNLESTPRLIDDCGEFDQDTGDKPWRSGIFVPWHAGILIQSSNDYEIICAASIVSPMYLISAANCFWDTSNNSLSTQTFFVGAGYENNNTFLQYRNVTNIITKDYLPEYWWNTVSRESHFNNIAIIKLDAALNFDENVKAVCLTPIFQKPQYFPHFDPYNLVSWARGNLYGRNSGNFEVTNSFFNAHCRGMVPKISAPEYMDSNRKKCFYVRDCGPDNDNGNGLSIKIKGRYYLYAISNPKIHTQRGYKCQYYTFTTLGLYFDFIKSNILI